MVERITENVDDSPTIQKEVDTDVNNSITEMVENLAVIVNII